MIYTHPDHPTSRYVIEHAGVFHGIPVVVYREVDGTEQFVRTVSHFLRSFSPLRVPLEVATFSATR